mmetsp:Transcript_32764/g.63175  ORF Transcript_32764/g.63175 Transcript_32764/m.63175 type:complete len:200 (-) Transcript_32764:379-978(-)
MIRSRRLTQIEVVPLCCALMWKANLWLQQAILLFYFLARWVVNGFYAYALQQSQQNAVLQCFYRTCEHVVALMLQALCHVDGEQSVECPEKHVGEQTVADDAYLIGRECAVVVRRQLVEPSRLLRAVAQNGHAESVFYDLRFAILRVVVGPSRVRHDDHILSPELLHAFREGRFCQGVRLKAVRRRERVVLVEDYSSDP